MFALSHLKAKGIRMVFLLHDPHNLLFTCLKTIPIIFLKFTLFLTKQHIIGNFVGLIAKTENIHVKTAPFPERREAWGEDFIKEDLN